MEYIKSKFLKVRKDKSKDIHVSVMDTADTKSMELTIKSMLELINSVAEKMETCI